MIFYILFNSNFLNNVFLVIYHKLLLLNMEIIFKMSFNFDYIEYLDLVMNNLNIINNNVILLDEQWYLNSDDPIPNDTYKLNETWYESIYYIDIIINFFDSFYTWVFIPFILCIIFIYILHSLGGLYSAYVDYYQKNPDHFSSARGFIPALFILFLFLFSFFSIFFFVKIQYLKYFLWVLFI